jgi:hypothetical protein
MLHVHAWDEISNKWCVWDLDLPPDCKDAERINQAIDKSCNPDTEYKDWRVAHFGEIGSAFVIETRDSHNHLSILLVISNVSKEETLTLKLDPQIVADLQRLERTEHYGIPFDPAKYKD